MRNRKDYFLYTGRKTNEISLPLGGIGTGCIGLAGNGRLIDWEIFNRPNKNSLNGFSHFAIKAEAGGKVIDARVLNGDLHPPYTGGGTAEFGGFGFGPSRAHMAGVPHFKSVTFRGEFPIAQLDFTDTPAFPGYVRMTAFNPFIPLNDKDSGIPAAFFEIEVANTSDEEIIYTLAGALGNPLPANNINTVTSADGVTLLHLTSDGLDPDDVKYGDLTLATDAADVSWQEYWYSGAWFDQLEIYWRDFLNPGKLINRTVDPSKAGRERQGMIAAHITLKPGETGRVRFVISWNFPNCENYWSESACKRACECGKSPKWKNYYATIWPDSMASARHAISEWDRLYDETSLFKNALFSSTLPPEVIDAVSANISILKTPTVMRLQDGTFYGWEGCHAQAGCCEGSCTHVWNYAQALPFLFPSLERSMREADYQYNLRPSGAMPFRIQLPLGVEPSSFRPCADGQFGGVMKVYRDWKISGDTNWLKRLWPGVKKSIEFAWSPENPDRWDPDKTGVLHGRQHHTLDMELFGPNSWLTGFYLGALKAGAEMAEIVGEPETAAEYRAIFDRGKAWADANLFNGEYYHQLINIKDKSALEPFGDALQVYWDEEHAEIKYQIAEGCQIDQLLAQWHANLYGLGEIFDLRQAKTALKSLAKHNFRPEMRDYFNACRVFCLNDESGLLIAHWPEGKYRPMIPIPYAGETMHGYEYAAAGLMIQNGLIDEGLAVVKAVRDRYDGERRNPWNEIECGSNYARSMASYALLNAFSGFEFDMARGMIGFDPIRLDSSRFATFWSLEGAWGTFRMDEDEAVLQVLIGSLTISELRMPGARADVRLGEKRLPCRAADGAIVLAEPVTIDRSEVLRVSFQ